MWEFVFKVSTGLIVLVFLFLCLSFAKPVTDGGKLSRKLAIANAVGWLIILPLSDRGHPPLWLIGLVPFWLLNLVLLPAALIALSLSYKQREERKSYLAIAGSYLILNVVVLFLTPAIWLVRNAT